LLLTPKSSHPRDVLQSLEMMSVQSTSISLYPQDKNQETRAEWLQDALSDG